MSLSHLKLRRMQRGLTAAAAFIFLAMSFQNCAPPGGSRQMASTNTNSTTPNTFSGSSSSLSTNSGTVGFTSNSGTGGSSSTVGTTSFGGTSAGSTQFKIVTQPTSANILEGAMFSLSAEVSGGKTPYQYQWYFNNMTINNTLGKFSIYSDMANRYSKAGQYKVIITDATGASITSSVANLGINEISGACSAGTYTMLASNSDPIGTALYQLYENPRGVYLINANNPDVNWMMSNPSYWGLFTYTYAAAASLEKRAVSCSTYIPRANDPRVYTSNNYGGGILGQPQWVSNGNVTVECHNQKWKVLSNTCQWYKKTQCTSIFGSIINCN